jgi:hypothetical protein
VLVSEHLQQLCWLPCLVTQGQRTPAGLKYQPRGDEAPIAAAIHEGRVGHLDHDNVASAGHARVTDMSASSDVELAAEVYDSMTAVFGHAEGESGIVRPGG